MLHFWLCGDDGYPPPCENRSFIRMCHHLAAMQVNAAEARVFQNVEFIVIGYFPLRRRVDFGR